MPLWVRRGPSKCLSCGPKRVDSGGKAAVSQHSEVDLDSELCESLATCNRDALRQLYRDQDCFLLLASFQDLGMAFGHHPDVEFGFLMRLAKTPPAFAQAALPELDRALAARFVAGERVLVSKEAFDGLLRSDVRGGRVVRAHLEEHFTLQHVEHGSFSAFDLVPRDR